MVVVIAILIVLAGILAPALQSFVIDAKANRILALCDLLKEACARFTADTNRSATELGLNPPFLDPTKHDLSLNSSVPGWKGPYIEKPLDYKDAPNDGSAFAMIWLEDRLICSLGTLPVGFDLKGNGVRLESVDPNIPGGNCLSLSRISPEVALAVNDKWDSTLGSTDWQTTGRVMYDEGEQVLCIFLLPPAK